MRIDVRKFLFIGAAAHRKAFFSQAQKEGVIEFIDPARVPTREVPKELHDINEAIKVLRGLPVVEQEERNEYSRAGEISGNILTLRGEEEKLREERRVLRQEIARVEPFGDFSLQEIKRLENDGNRVVQFFASKKQVEAKACELPEVIWLNSSHGLDYYISLNKEPQRYEGMIEMKIEQPVGSLRRRFNVLEMELDVVEAKLRVLAKENDYLHEALRNQLNKHNLTAAEKGIEGLLESRIFAVQGWVAEHHLDRARALSGEHDIDFSEVAIEETDHVPTYLENTGYARIGEDLVHIYDTPSIGDKDPSPWVLWSFALFFAIILGDGGYGLIFLALSLGLWMKFPKAKGALRRFMKLATILSVSCIGWGLLTNSFFGIGFDIDSSVREVSGLQWLVEQKADYHHSMQDGVYSEWVAKFPGVATASSGYESLQAAVLERAGKVSWPMLDKYSDSLMLELALVIGIIHITLSLLRSIRESWAGVGWILLMVGGYLYVPDYLHCTSLAQILGGLDKSYAAELGYQLIFTGLGAAVVLALVQHKSEGAAEIINLIQVFSDVLSYLRLYALGLAGSMMSSTFNEIGASAPFIAGFFIILIGHVVNIVLGIMGGVIHGLRLNFLEWYHYCFEGGGRMFKPLEMIEVKES